MSQLVTPHKTYHPVSKLAIIYNMCFPIQICNPARLYKTYHLVSKLVIMYNMCFPIQICNPARLYKPYHLV